MKEIYSTQIFSALELNIAAKTLGIMEEISLPPVFETEEPLEERMLKGVIDLTEKGMLHVENGCYSHSNLMEWYILPLAFSDCKYRMSYNDRLLWVFEYQGDVLLMEKCESSVDEYSLCRVKKEVFEVHWQIKGGGINSDNR